MKDRTPNDPTPEQIAERAAEILAEKLEAENEARIVGGKNAHIWNVPVVKHRNVPPMKRDYN